MTRAMRRALLQVWVAAVCLLLTAVATADDPPPRTPLDIIATPIFGSGSLPMGGWGEILVRITNRGQDPFRGKVTVFGASATWSSDDVDRTDAPFSAAAGASVSLRVPVRITVHSEPAIRVFSEEGDQLYQQTFSRITDNRTVLLDIAKTSALGAAVRGVRVGSNADPWSPPTLGYRGPTRSDSVVDVFSPIYDPVTGDPLLPQRAAGYSRAAVVLARSEELARLPAAELEALSGFVLSGGTLALVITRPEDMRDPVVVSFCGDAVIDAKLEAPNLEPIMPFSPPPGSSLGGQELPKQRTPESYLTDTLRSFEGGNLRPSAYGASGPYGLGEVHLLSFDPQTKPGVDSAWVHIRMVDMLRRANERVAAVLFRPGEPVQQTNEIRRRLDPNEGSRWAIVLTALLLLAYAVVAGPVNFNHWRKRGRPLRALLYLPLLSASTFAAVVVVGVLAKGCSGRARHLTVVEAGAGMTTGVARRYRGFYVPSAQDLSVTTTHASSVLGTAESGDETQDLLVVDRDSLRLVDLHLRPWETMVVREDGLADLGEGVAIVEAAAGEVDVINHTERALLGLVLRMPDGTVGFARELAPGDTLTAGDWTRVSRVVQRTSPGTRGFDPLQLRKELDDADEGLSLDWQAVSDVLHYESRDWFPNDVPVLLAMVEGGEGRDRDGGLGIDMDRVLVRVVGWGGTR